MMGQLHLSTLLKGPLQLKPVLVAKRFIMCIFIVCFYLAPFSMEK